MLLTLLYIFAGNNQDTAKEFVEENNRIFSMQILQQQKYIFILDLKRICCIILCKIDLH